MMPEELDRLFFNGYDLFYIEGYLVQDYELIKEAISLAHQSGLKVALDLASYNVVSDHTPFLLSLFQQVDIVFANEEEARALCGLEPDRAVDYLAGLVETVIVKKGKKGAIARRKEERAAAPAIEVSCVDTTGAGDLFASGFLYGLAHQSDLERCLACGNLVAGHVVEWIGTRMDDKAWSSITEQLKAIIGE
jgi:sugar/nucleoside kinase (ribokinase family)